MRRVVRDLTGSVLGLALLAACSPGTPTPTPTVSAPSSAPTSLANSPTSTPAVTPSGVTTPLPSPTSDGLGRPWKFSTTEGASGGFEVPSKSNALVRRVEKERRIGKGKKLYYVSVSIDNRAGSADVQLQTLEFVSAGEKRLPSVRPQDVIGRWQQPTGNPSRLRLIDLQNDLERTVKPGERATVVKIFEKPIRVITRSFIYLDGDREVVEARPR